jgi:Collagen triple helix repeat (20 copies)
MLSRTPGTFRWIAIAALVALVISVPALAVAQRSSSSGGSAAKTKKKAKKKSLRGPRGPRGTRGLQGFAGRAGKDGAAGPTGPIGPKGDKGQTGDQRTKVLNVAMAAGDADIVVVNYPPFTITARCHDDGGTFSARLVATTSTDDSYLDSAGDDAADFDSGSGEKTLGVVTGVAPADAPATHPEGAFAMSALPGAGVTGQFSIGTNVYPAPGAAPKSCLFLGSVTTAT